MNSTTYTASVDYGPNATGWLAVSGGAAPGTLTLSPTTTNLGPGTFTANVILTPTSGSSLSVPVSYNLAASSLTLNPGTSSFAIDGSSTSATSFTRRVVTTGDTGATLNWTASSSVPWLTVTASGTSGNNAVLNLVPAELASVPNGASTAVVTFTYSGPGLLSATHTLPVTLNLNLPTINFVAPYVAYINEQQEVIIRGSGFAQAGAGPVMFDGLAAQTSVVRSDTEIRALPPLFSSSARPQISIGNNLGVNRSCAELVVRAQPNYPYSSLATDIGRQNLHLVYDAERDVVFSASAYFELGSVLTSFVRRFRYDAGSGTWSMASQRFPLLFDIAMSPDGRELLVLCSTQLHRVNPVTLAINSTVKLPGTVGGTASQLAVANDGRVLLRDLNRSYSLIDNTFTTLQFPSRDAVGIDMSADGSRAVMGAATNSGDIPLSLYDASTGTIQSTSAFQYYSPGSMNRTGTKILSGQFVRGADFAVFGELRNGALPLLGDVMDPLGANVYVYSTTGGSLPQAFIRVFDVRVSAPVFPELATITLADVPGIARLLVSLDSETLFVVGDERFVVQPLP